MHMLLMATSIGSHTAPVGVHWKPIQLQSARHSDARSHDDPADYAQIRYLTLFAVVCPTPCEPARGGVARAGVLIEPSLRPAAVARRNERILAHAGAVAARERRVESRETGATAREAQLAEREAAVAAVAKRRDAELVARQTAVASREQVRGMNRPGKELACGREPCMPKDAADSLQCWSTPDCA